MAAESDYNTAVTRLRHVSYVRNHRAVVALWGLFVLIALVLNVLVFLQPQWIGDTGDSAVPGYLGTWEYCVEEAPGRGYQCQGDFLAWDSILNGAFQATSLLVGISCLLLLLSIGCFVLFCLLNTATVLRVCGWFQLPAALVMAAACVIFPTGWDDLRVRQVCGQQAGEFDLGSCGVRWGFVLAIVLVFDALILAVLAFVLAGTTAKSLSKEAKEKEALQD